MVKGSKNLKLIKGERVAIRLSIPKKTHKALKVKCALMDTTVNQIIIEHLQQWTKTVEPELEELRAKM